MTQFSDKPVEPGFYQNETQFGGVGGARLTGRKSGRVSPRDHVRQPAWEDTLQKHDLLPMNKNQVGSNASFDRNQGQLFDTESVTPRDTRSDVEIANSYGAPTGAIEAATSKKQNPSLGAVPGYMPSLTTKQKVGAIDNMAAARATSGADRGTGAPFAEMMQDRQVAYDKGRKADWYMGTDSSGQYDRSIQGSAPAQIQASAARTGNTSGGQTRAVAMTSPQMAWKSEGTTNDTMAHQTERMSATSGVYPNVSVAEDVIKTGKQGGNVEQNISDRMFMEPEDRALDMNSSQTDHPSALGGTPGSRTKAATKAIRKPGEEMGAYPIQDIKSQKAPNFEASLNLSHIDPAVQRIAAQSFTVDRHDGAGVGIDVEGKEFKRRGSYEAVAMTGRRAALKNRELPPNEQAIEWESRRADKGLGAGNQMFSAGTTIPRPDLRPAQAAPKSRTQRRGRYDPASDPDGPGF